MAVSQSAAAYTQMMAELDKKKQIETGTPRAEKVKEITDKLVAAGGARAARRRRAGSGKSR